jgi:hypothetical protein
MQPMVRPQCLQILCFYRRFGCPRPCPVAWRPRFHRLIVAAQRRGQHARVRPEVVVVDGTSTDDRRRSGKPDTMGSDRSGQRHGVPPLTRSMDANFGPQPRGVVADNPVYPGCHSHRADASAAHDSDFTYGPAQWKPLRAMLRRSGSNHELDQGDDAHPHVVCTLSPRRSSLERGVNIVMLFVAHSSERAARKDCTK